MAPRKPATRKRKPDNVHVVLVDIGANMEGQPFQDAIQTVEWLLTRKIMRSKDDAEKATSGGQDLFGVIAFGSDETDNHLKTPRVICRQEVLTPASFDQLRFLSELSPGKKPGDYSQAMIQSIDWLKQRLDECEEVASTNLILITNALGERDSKTHRARLEVIANSLAALNTELHVIGLTEPYESYTDKELAEFVEEHDGSLYSYSEVSALISKLSAYQQLTRLVGFSLEISPKVKLPFKCIPYISKARSLKEEKMRSVDPRSLQKVNREKKLFIVEEKEDDGTGNGGPHLSNDYSDFNGRNTEMAGPRDRWGAEIEPKKEEPMDYEESTQRPSTQVTYTQVADEERAYGYFFGSTKIAMTKEDRDKYNLSFNYNKSSVFQLICTVPEDAIKIPHLAGADTRVFIPDERKAKGLGLAGAATFVQGLIESGTVAIARFAYNAASQPQMIALKPRIHAVDGTPLLCAVRIPFADDIRHTTFPPLEKVDQIKSIKKLDLLDELIDEFMGDENNKAMDSRRMRAAYLRKHQLIFDKLNLRTSVVKAETEELTEKQKEIVEKVKAAFPIVDYKAERAMERERERKRIDEVDVDALLEGHQDEAEDDEDMKPAKAELDAKIEKAAGDEKKGMTMFLKDQFAHIIVNAGEEDVDLDKLKFARSWCIRTNEPKLFNDLMGRLTNLDDVREWVISLGPNPVLRPITNKEAAASEIDEARARDWWKADDDEDE
ncbi:unnamed protein product, partial [Mesorhabditis spiculigera]